MNEAEGRKVPNYRSCDLELQFGDGDYVFKLTAKHIAELQVKCDAGILEIYERVVRGTAKLEDLTEPVRLGLIGGGVSAPEARRLCDVYVPGGDVAMALDWWRNHSLAILAACVHGYQPPEDEVFDPPEGEEEPEKKTPST